MDNIYIPMELNYVEPFSFDDYDDEYVDEYTFAEIGYNSDDKLENKIGYYIFDYIKNSLGAGLDAMQIDADWIGIDINADEYDYTSDDVIRAYIYAIRNARKDFGVDIEGKVFKKEKDIMGDNYTDLYYII